MKIAAKCEYLIAGLLSRDPSSAIREIESHRLWDRVATVAWQKRVGGIVLARLHELDVTPPDDALRELRAYARHIAAANRRLLDRALPVVERLNAAGIANVLLKGAALHASLYADLSQRPMVDVDILIAERDAADADDVLRSVGWEPGADLVRPDFFPRFHYEREYLTTTEPAARIDLHVRPFRPMPCAATVPTDDFIESSQLNRLEGVPIHTLRPDRMLIHLAAHAAFHGATELRWLYDIYEWTRRFGSELDVAEIASIGDAWRLSHPVRTAVNAVARRFGSHDHLERLLRALPDAPTLADRLMLWQAPHGDRRHVTDVIVNTLLTKGLRRRLTYLVAVALPNSAHLAQIYPHRHAGWTVAANATRLARIAARPFMRHSTAA